ncbi:MAG: hypothetical protein HY366_01765 [Candidatus Aenigmarchaeota archaeon]|nr:hypothetical protein [Candidatus Aenigmarchaeota archaeon]
MKKGRKETLTIALLAALIVVTAFNTIQIASLSSTTSGIPLSYESSAVGIADTLNIIPRGTPDIYGKELGVSYDDVSAASPQKADETIRKLGLLDVNTELAGADLQRYVGITSQLSCEYCCGAESIIFPDGSAACGCAHSYAMRGLAKYLITEHGSMTDDAILEELGKWKTLFFPEQITAKARVLQSRGIELNYVNMASNKYRGITSDGGMVGGC